MGDAYNDAPPTGVGTVPPRYTGWCIPHEPETEQFKTEKTLLAIRAEIIENSSTRL